MIVWEELNLIIEGHWRHKLFSKHGLVPKYLRVSFKTRQDAMAYAIRAQRGRRNMSAGAIADKMEKCLSPNGVGPHGPTPTGGGEGPSIAEVAEAAGVSENTVKRNRRKKKKESEPKLEKPHPKRPELEALKKLDTMLGVMIRSAVDVNKDLCPSQYFQEFERGMEIACQALTKWRRAANK